MEICGKWFIIWMPPPGGGCYYDHGEKKLSIFWEILFSSTSRLTHDYFALQFFSFFSPNADRSTYSFLSGYPPYIKFSTSASQA